MKPVITPVSNPVLPRWFCLGILALAALLLAGCGNKMVAVSVGGYNHMPDDGGWAIASFSVNGSGGPNLSPESGDHGSNCCVMLPEKWHPGMTAKVYWRYTPEKDNDTRPLPPRQEAEVEIPDYSERGPGPVEVHFYANNRIKVVVSSYGIENPQYPMSAADKLPWKTREDLLDLYPLWQEKKP
ncbi:MAG: DUF3304 domain-containing protein [Burkholderiaceae bacterium]|jgi:hypothetical protein|nr:DUF3304 domain-containing protein [Burkholderiaceae bacterium]